jgi:RNA polymerase sigma-70 factor (ECF subfamily)
MNSDGADDKMHTSAENGTGQAATADSDSTVPNDQADAGAVVTGSETLIDIETGEILVEVQPPTFAAFYEAERATIVRALSLALHDTDFGAEAADEALVRACQSWANVGTYRNPTGWVYRVGLNWANSALRKRRRHRSKMALIARADSTADSTPDIDLQRALSQLSDAHRAVVVCRYYLDFSVSETAEALGVPVGTIKSRASRALEQLEGLLINATTEHRSPSSSTETRDSS